MAWSEGERDEIVKGLAVACEVTGTHMSGPAKTFMLRELESYSAQEVLSGLTRSARECQGRLSLAAIVKAIEFVDRKALSDARAERSIYLTQLRGAALVERIPWNAEYPEEVRRALEEKGYRFKSAPQAPKALPHWSETERDDP